LSIRASDHIRWGILADLCSERQHRLSLSWGRLVCEPDGGEDASPAQWSIKPKSDTVGIMHPAPCPPPPCATPNSSSTLLFTDAHGTAITANSTHLSTHPHPRHTTRNSPFARKRGFVLAKWVDCAQQSIGRSVV
jgi:hypothetical protein